MRNEVCLATPFQCEESRTSREDDVWVTYLPIPDTGVSRGLASVRHNSGVDGWLQPEDSNAYWSIKFLRLH